MMQTFICENVFVPLRSGPSHRAEMLSQVLFGEKYTILDRAGHWFLIENSFDRCRGWIDADHLQHSETDETDESESHVLNRSLVCYKNDNTKLVLEAGCEIFNPDFSNSRFRIRNNIYTTDNSFNDKYLATTDSFADLALKFINSPYIWGGRIPSGIDCSGLTQLVYKIKRMAIPRNSWQQAEKGSEISFINESRPGDLVFFDDEKGKISHVGMIISTGLVIHASGRVRIDTIDHQGIFKKEIGGYSHRLRTIRRIV